MKAGKLSSDILEAQFGSTAVEILFQGDAERIIATRAQTTSQLLELSLVTFADTHGYTQIHQRILDGESMGKAFRAADVAFERRTYGVWREATSGVFAEVFGAGNMWVVEVDILVGSSRTLYATIIETYAPALRWPEPETAKSQASKARLAEFAELLDQKLNE